MTLSTNPGPAEEATWAWLTDIPAPLITGLVTGALAIVGIVVTHILAGNREKRQVQQQDRTWVRDQKLSAQLAFMEAVQATRGTYAVYSNGHTVADGPTQQALASAKARLNLVSPDSFGAANEWERAVFQHDIAELEDLGKRLEEVKAKEARYMTMARIDMGLIL